MFQPYLPSQQDTVADQRDNPHASHLRHHVLHRWAQETARQPDSGRLSLVEGYDITIPELELYAAR